MGGAGGDGVRWTSNAAWTLGWSELNQARGGTGYVGASDVCGWETCPNYRGVLEELDDNYTPSIVVVAGGSNDVSATDREFAEAARLTFTAIREKYPDTQILALPPTWVDGRYPNSAVTREEAVRAAATDAGGTYLDIGHPILEHPEWITDDGIHPDARGYLLYADRVVEAYRSVFPG